MLFSLPPNKYSQTLVSLSQGQFITANQQKTVLTNYVKYFRSAMYYYTKLVVMNNIIKYMHVGITTYKLKLPNWRDS